MFDAEINRALTAAVDLLNTAGGRHSAKPSTDDLTSIEGLKTYISAQDSALKWPASGLDRAQVDDVRDLRGTLSEIWRAAPITTDEPVERINDLLEGVGTRIVRADDAGSPAPEYRSEPIPLSGRAAEVITATVADALQHLVVRGETGRMRICRGEDCDAAIIDLTRNRSKLFCDFGNCANRAHVRAYRARQAALREAGKRALAQDTTEQNGDAGPLAKPSAAEKAAQLKEPTSASAVAAKEFRDRMRDELMETREKKDKKSKKKKGKKKAGK